MLTTAQVEHYHAEGYVAVPGFLSAELNGALSMLQSFADSMFQCAPTILGCVGLVFRSQEQ